MMTSAGRYVVTEKLAGVYYITNNEAYIPDHNNESNGVQPYSPAVVDQPYNPAVAGQPYNPAVADQLYNPAMVGQPYPIHVTVASQARQPTPKSCLAYSIFTCIFCFFPFGIVAIVMSRKSRQARRKDDLDKARSYGKKACIVSTVALISGIAIIIAVLLTQVLACNSTSYYFSEIIPFD